MHMRFLVAGFIVVLVMVAGQGTVSSPAVHAQEDAQTPVALCDAATAEIAEPETRSYEEPESVLEPGVDYHAIFCTDRGPIYVDLFEQLTPVTVNNFVFLAEQDYYNNTVFHRVIPDFMVQGGDPTGTGSGGPGYEFQDEFVPFLQFNQPGLLAMANAGPTTNGSQFFITRVPTPHLDPYQDPASGALRGHTIFGHVLEGQDVVSNITDRDPQTQPDVVPDTLQTVLIIEDPSTVDSSYEAPATPDAEAVFETLTTDSFAEISNILVGEAGYGPVEDQTRLFADAESALEIYSEGVQESVAEMYSENGFQFKAQGLWQQNQCPQQPGLLGFGLSISDWGTQAQASNVITDYADVVTVAQEDLGFTAVEVEDQLPALSWNGSLHDSPLLFQKTTSEFCDVEADQFRYIWNRGHYTLTLDIVVDFRDTLELTEEEFMTAIIGDAISPLAAIADDAVFSVTYPGVTDSAVPSEQPEQE